MKFNRLTYFKQSLEFRFETLNDYIEESHQNLITKQKILDNELSETLEGIDDPDYTQNIIDNHLDENLKYFKDFPSYFNESSFLMIYSFLEANLARICKYARLDLNTHNPKTPITTLPTKSYIQDSKIYLETTCRLSLKSKENVWRKLDKLRDFRNFIAHNNLDLKQTKNAIEKARKKETINYINRVFKKCVTIDYAEKYKIENHQLIVETIKLVEEYLFYVIEVVPKKCK